jgi:hypothetical protein
MAEHNRDKKTIFSTCIHAEGGTLLYDRLGLKLGLNLSTKGIVPHSD